MTINNTIHKKKIPFLSRRGKEKYNCTICLRELCCITESYAIFCKKQCLPSNENPPVAKLIEWLKRVADGKRKVKIITRQFPAAKYPAIGQFLRWVAEFHAKV